MKITDKMRLDWLLNFRAELSTIKRYERILDNYYDKGLSPRQAIDAEIKAAKKHKGKPK